MRLRAHRLLYLADSFREPMNRTPILGNNPIAISGSLPVFAGNRRMFDSICAAAAHLARPAANTPDLSMLRTLLHAKLPFSLSPFLPDYPIVPKCCISTCCNRMFLISFSDYWYLHSINAFISCPCCQPAPYFDSSLALNACLGTTDRRLSSREILPNVVITLIVDNALACFSRTGVLKSAQLGSRSSYCPPYSSNISFYLIHVCVSQLQGPAC